MGMGGLYITWKILFILFSSWILMIEMSTYLQMRLNEAVYKD